MPNAPTILTREIHRRAFAHDASHYLLYPREVWVARSVADVAAAMRGGAERGLPVTFRAGGTSLSGQGVGEGILVDVRQGFRAMRVLDGGERVWAQGGLTIRHLNTVLATRSRALGPDPASEIAATLGGVIANNSSGMACGVRHNAYQLVEAMTFVLPSGTVIDTREADGDDVLAAAEPHIYRTLLDLRDRLRGDPAAASLIARQFAMKNTMGYGLNSFLDFERPIDILTHLLIGSEGTLGFVADVTMRTVEILPRRAVALVVFASLDDAVRAIPGLREAGVHTAELMDARSLAVAQRFEDVPGAIAGLEVTDQCALLLECRGRDEADLDANVAAARAALTPLGVAADFTSDDAECTLLWTVRKGLYAACAGSRSAGTTALLEDIVVPVAALATTCRELSGLFDRYGYDDAVIFGHAKDGNLHFMITDDFTRTAARERLAAFSEDMVDLVLRHGGNLKAEHGTGRAMAPFLTRQYGAELVAMMRELKDAIDPQGLLNPGVILPEREDAHLTDFKAPIDVRDVIDACVECGYCEPRCPSQDLTLTPRTRIVIMREIERARRAGDRQLAAQLQADYDYQGVQTCAVDGMCETACPMAINTGDLVRELRAEDAGAWATLWRLAARYWSGVTAAGALALTAASHLPSPLLRGATRLGRAVLGAERVPLWDDVLPRGGKRRRRPAPAHAAAVYLPSCLGALFDSGGATSLQEDLELICERTGIGLLVPPGIDAACCGTPWSSKGMSAGYELMRERVVAMVRAASQHGELPIVCDASSCTEGLTKLLAGQGLRVIDAPTFLAEHVLPALDLAAPELASLTIHPTCSTTRLGSSAALAEVGRALAREVHVPASAQCCGMAGDRGLLHPELAASATAREAAEVNALDASAHASANRTCELAMTRATGRTYEGIVQLLADAVRRASTS
ncbi:D-lactate dehydrogenase [Bowdeniella nasicola]|uniref:D-lactate dehydrogenase (cytochrome) n=1 Tax=Bowdeniella nasicola TaxID=208480 RepID=A0A1H4ACB5_9ACTO|nr:FAD-binding and (Fe-S)-binding domain-containing protein [Bowdeniella nasicola]SEA33192.1 D-lactate dehydrogenase [Bowdeniella nasicola]